MSSRLRWYEYAIAMIPLVLDVSFGVLGLTLGPAATAINLAIMGTKLPRAMRIVSALISSAAAALLWSWLAVSVP